MLSTPRKCFNPSSLDTLWQGWDWPSATEEQHREGSPVTGAEALGTPVTTKVREMPPSRTLHPVFPHLQPLPHIKAPRQKNANTDLYLQMRGPHSGLPEGRRLRRTGPCRGSDLSLTHTHTPRAKSPPLRRRPHQATLGRFQAVPRATPWTQNRSPILKERARENAYKTAGGKKNFPPRPPWGAAACGGRGGPAARASAP